MKAYAGKDIPVEYAKKEAEAKAKAVEEWERKNPHGNSVGGGWLSSAVSGLAGVRIISIECTDINITGSTTTKPAHDLP